MRINIVETIHAESELRIITATEGPINPVFTQVHFQRTSPVNTVK